MDARHKERTRVRSASASGFLSEAMRSSRSRCCDGLCGQGARPKRIAGVCTVSESGEAATLPIKSKSGRPRKACAHYSGGAPLSPAFCPFTGDGHSSQSGLIGESSDLTGGRDTRGSQCGPWHRSSGQVMVGSKGRAPKGPKHEPRPPVHGRGHPLDVPVNRA